MNPVQNLASSQISAQNKHWSIQTKLLIGTVVITLAALAIIKGMAAYTHYQNGKITDINCHFGETVDGVLHDFTYYRNAAEKGSASDQYCLAEMFKSGNGTKPSLAEARDWFKKAFDQGLSMAKFTLCQPEMFEVRCKDRSNVVSKDELKKCSDIFNRYCKFIDICCPLPSERCPGVQPECPWEKGPLGSMRMFKNFPPICLEYYGKS